MNGLLPHSLRDIVAGKSVFAASQSFGVVTLALLVVLLLETEVLRLTGSRTTRHRALAIATGPLFIAVILTVAARLGVIIQ
jgi:hypothetical protein